MAKMRRFRGRWLALIRACDHGVTTIALAIDDDGEGSCGDRSVENKVSVIRANLHWQKLPETELWESYRSQRDPLIREYFVKQYAPLVKYVAGRVAIGMPNAVDFDDLVQCGMFGLFDAISKFDPTKHVKFKTYAVTRIRGAIFDELRAIDWVPRSVRQKAREVQDTVRGLEASLGRAATDEEIAAGMGIAVKEFQRILVKVAGTAVVSLNDVWHGGEDDDRVSIAESIESPVEAGPATIAEKEEMKRVIVEAIKDLPENEQQVLVLYYYEELTLKEIGQVLEVTESRVSQLHTKARLRLRTKLTNVKSGI